MKPAEFPTLSASGNIFFVTLRLRDALPDSLVQNLRLQYYTQRARLASNPDAATLLTQTRKRLFAHYDDTLDLSKHGHPYFRVPALAQIVADEIRRYDGTAFELLAYCIMPNHAHLLFGMGGELSEDPPIHDLESFDFKPLRDIVAQIQNATEKPLKKAIKQLGEHIDPTVFQKQTTVGSIKMEGAIWQAETFDFRVQDANGFEKIAHYIFQNPVKAELIEHREDWPFSYWKGRI